MTKKINLLKPIAFCMLSLPFFGSGIAYAHSTGERITPRKSCATTLQSASVKNSTTALPEVTGMFFIENKGQVKDQNGQQRHDIDYKLVTGSDINIFIGSSGIYYQWNVKNKENGEIQSNRVEVSIVGGNKDAALIKEDRQDYFELYHFNADAKGTKAETYKKVIYKDIYPNIDWILYLDGDRLEYDFRVHPGGKVSDIALQYDGSQSLGLKEDGSFFASNVAGHVIENAPISFEASGKSVASHFVLKGNRLAFEIGDYNVEETLIIDPIVEWATYYGGIGAGYQMPDPWFGGTQPVAEWDLAAATAFDKDLNVYMTGLTNSITNIATTGAFQQTWGGSPDTTSAPDDAFLVKFDKTGKRLWATYYGGQGSENGTAITCDEQGNVYMVGFTSSKDVNLSSPNSYQNTLNGASDAFIVKFDGEGTRLWATYFGGNGTDGASSVISDKGGHIYIAGSTTSTNGLTHLAPGAGYVFQNAIGGGQDAFLAKFTEDGEPLWATYYGGSGSDVGNSLAWDANNQVIYLAGQTDASTNLGTPNVFQDTLGLAGDAFVAKFNVQGQRIWGTYFGGEGMDYGVDVECDDAGNIYLTGLTMSKTLATPGAFLDSISNIGSYLTKFHPDGKRDWTTYASGNMLYVAIQGYSVYVGGQTADTSGIGTPGAPFERIVGAADVYLMKFDTTGTREWGTYFGSSANDNGGYLDCDGFGNIYLTGRATVPSAITGGIGLATPGAHQDTFATGGNAGSWDAFLVKFSDCVYDLAITIDSLTMGVTGSSIYKDFQWYKDGNLIDGANDTVYTATKNGVYSVTVRSALNGCTDSASYEITNIVEDGDDGEVAIADVDEQKIKVYPNPAHDILFIQAPYKVDVTLKSVDGKVVLRAVDVQSIDIRNLSSGMYFLNLTDKDGHSVHTEKLIKTGK